MREVLTNTASAREHVRDRRSVVRQAGNVVEVAVDFPCQRFGSGANGPTGREALTRVLLDSVLQWYVARAHPKSTGF